MRRARGTTLLCVGGFFQCRNSGNFSGAPPKFPGPRSYPRGVPRHGPGPTPPLLLRRRRRQGPAGAGPVGALDYELSRCKHNCLPVNLFHPGEVRSAPKKPTRAHTPASPSSQVNPKLNRRLRTRRRTRFVRFCPDPLCQIFSPRRSPFCPPKNPHARTHRPYPSAHFNPKLNGRLRARRRTRALSVFAQIR